MLYVDISKALSDSYMYKVPLLGFSHVKVAMPSFSVMITLTGFGGEVGLIA